MDEQEMEGKLSKQKATINNIESLAGLPQTGGTDQLSTRDFEVRLDLLEKYWQKCVHRDRSLQRCAEELANKTYFSAQVFGKAQNIYLVTKSWMLGEIQRRAPQVPLQRSLENRSAQPAATMMAAQTALESVKLPTFNGSQRDWEPFKENFVSLVLDDATMPDVIKFQRLLNALEGEAADTLQGTKVVTANFPSAWTTLCERYDNKPLRFSLQMKTLISMPPSTRESASHINQLLNTTNEAINNFRELACPIEHWDDMLIYFLESKLPARTHMDWVETIEREKLGEFPKYEQLKTFLQDRVRSLELVDAKMDNNNQEKSKSSNQPNNKPADKQQKKSQVLAVAKTDNRDKSRPNSKCSLCEGFHFLAYCFKFSNLPLDKRKAHVESTNLCFNCLNTHRVDACTSKKRCFVCGSKHHTKIHQDKQSSNPTQQEEAQSSRKTMVVSCSAQTLATSSRNSVMLSTACIALESPTGKRVKLRALLDSCSEESFLTYHAAQMLELPLNQAELSCSGLGDTKVTVARRQATVILKSDSHPEFSLEFSPYILSKLTSQSPREEINISGCKHLKNLRFADPDFVVPGRIDCLLGSAVFSVILLDRIRRGMPNQPVALQSIFGWIVLGAESSNSTSGSARVLHTVTHSEAAELNETLTKFWELEEIPKAPTMSPDEKACYAHFKKTHYRNEDGRFVLRLPFRLPPILPDTLKSATACMTRHIKRFERQPELAMAYTEFIDEYRQLQHMEPVPDYEVNTDHYCYIPHHPVFRKDSGKIRVVFNASQHYSNGQSLNSFLHVGPKLQEDVQIIILRWSFFQFVFTCDGVKMFRQFLTHPADRDWQRIVWKSSSKAPLSHFRLSTVSYGQACDPFQSNAAMLQLADDEQETYPRGAEALRKSRYADDFYVGEDTVAEAQFTVKQLVDILSSAGMEVGKWAANHSEILQNIHQGRCSDVAEVAHEQEGISTLGLRWNPTKDCFFFRISAPDSFESVTKRSILSEISRLFDPIGFDSAVTIRAKILLQNLWLMKIGWDEPVPSEVAEVWITFRNQLSELETIEIPRWIGTVSDSEWHIHGFCDASERAYAAVLYFVVHKQGNILTKFITAKSKVVPVKAVSLPRLELCGAHLLSRLVAYVLAGISRTPTQIHCWSDSKIVLAWLQSHSSRWKAFIANRVSEITSAVPAAVWRHVPSADNPADLASRGVSSTQLKESRLWWSGPDWLLRPQSEWPTAPKTFHTDLEARSKEAHVFISQSPTEFEQWCARFSFIEKIIRILAYIYRWRSIIKIRQDKRKYSWLTVKKLAAGETLMFKGLQRVAFAREIQSLMDSKHVLQTSSIRRLAPFLDELGVVRVGGRLPYRHSVN